MEGGDEGEGEKAMGEGEGDKGMTAMDATVTDPRTKSTDTDAFSSFADVPMCFLRNCIHNPYFGDLVKSHVVNWEFFPKKPSADTWGDVAGLMTSGLASSARTEADAWFSGYVGEFDHLSLTEMGALTEKAPILFPGWIEGWANEQDAIDYAKTLAANNESKNAIKQVVVKVSKASVLTVAGNRSVAHRLQGTLQKVEEKDGTTFIEIDGLPHDDRTIEQAEKDKADALAAAAAKEKEGAEGDKGMGEGDKGMGEGEGDKGMGEGDAGMGGME